VDMEVRVKAHDGHHLEQTRASSGTSVLSRYGAIASHAPCCGHQPPVSYPPVMTRLDGE
jgi:hypothetical protein